MKKWMLLLLGVVTFSFTSCLNDDEDTPTLSYDLGIVTDVFNGYTILTDNKDTLYTSQTLSSSTFTLTEGTRIYFTYTVLKEGTAADDYTKKISIEKIIKVPVNPIITLNSVNRDTIGNDNVAVYGLSIGSKYLNVDYGFYATGNKPHYFSLVYDAEKQNVDGYTVFEFRHKDNDDLMSGSARDLRSYDLSTFQWTGTAPHKLIFRFKDYNSTVNDVKFEYTPPTL